MINFDFTLIFNVVNFAILYFILRKVLFLPILDYIYKQREFFKANSLRTEEIIEETEVIYKSYNDRLKKAKQDSLVYTIERKQLLWDEREKKINDTITEYMQKVEKSKKETIISAQKAKESLASKVEKMSDKIVNNLLEREVFK
ncbi:MAG: hypothetical protein ACD_79C00288G0006 [uncultured bacterium]|nr:MAG: hypothetical protein ACD_79C00288G0006 [uncultured bacterium]